MDHPFNTISAPISAPTVVSTPPLGYTCGLCKGFVMSGTTHLCRVLTVTPNTIGIRLVGVPICPDLLDYDALGEADNWHGRIVRAFFWCLLKVEGWLR